MAFWRRIATGRRRAAGDTGAAPRRGPGPRWLAPLCLAALPFLVYGRFILLGDELANADVFLAYRPAHAWLGAGLRRGHVPLWNPYLLGGFPLAFTEYGWFSPLNWLPLILFGPHAGYYAAVALYVALASVMAYGLARSWGASPSGAVLAGLIYSQSLLVVGGAPLINQGAAYWALPAMLWSARAHIRGHPLGAPALGAVLALCLLGSHPQQAILATAPMALYLLWWAGASRRIWSLLPVAGAVALGAAVATVRYLPTLSLVEASERAGGLSASAQALGSVSPLALLAGLTFPSLRLPLNLLEPHWTAYLGPLPLLLAVAGLRSRRAQRTGSGPAPGAPGARRFLLALGGAGAILALGTSTPLYWMIGRTPLLSYFREPSRFLLWTVLAVAMLAPWGLERLTETRAPQARRTPARLSDADQGNQASGPLGRRSAARPGRWWWLGAVLLALTTAGFGALQAALRLNERYVLNAGRLRAISQARSGDYPTSFYVEGVDAAWRQALRATNPLHPGLLIPLCAFAGALWWWRWGRNGSHPRAMAVAAGALPLLLYGQVRLPAIPAAVVREASPGGVVVQGAGALSGVAGRPAGPSTGQRPGGQAQEAAAPAEDAALTPRVLAWLPLATDFETRRRAEALGANADVISYRLLQRFLAPNLGMSYAVPLVDGYENLMTREQALLAGALGSERAGTAGDASATGLSPLPLQTRRQRMGERWGLLGATGAGTLLSGDRLRPETWPTTVRYERAAVPGADGVPPLNAYRFIRPLPRAFVTTEWTVAENAAGALQALLEPPAPAGSTGGLGGPAVVVVAAPGGPAPPAPPAGRVSPGGLDGLGPFEARIVRYDERLVEVETESDAGALLVLLDAYAPGWTATVTGAPATIHLANVAYRAVPLPAGRHLVRFTYTPPGWPGALGITAGATLALSLWALWALLAGARSPRPVSAVRVAKGAGSSPGAGR